VLRDGTPKFSWFYFSHPSMAGIAGNPSLTLPAGLSAEGFPVGLSVDGLPGGDRPLLGIGLLLEALLGRLPPPALAV
jgi:mandelamide amidase